METNQKRFYEGTRLAIVVDDEYVNRMMLGHILEQGGYEVIYSENGEEALNAIRENQEKLPVVMLDLNMPVMDGIELLKIRQEDEALSRIPVIVVTAEKDEEEKALRLGASDFIKKPYDMPAVILARTDRIVELTEDRQVIQTTERDNLSGLYTKQFFMQYVRRNERFHDERPMDVIALNLDRFHLVNELYGREFGDKTLYAIGRGILGYLKKNPGIACRGEADMFYIYSESADEYDTLQELIREEFEKDPRMSQLRLRSGVFQAAGWEREIESRCDQAKLACDSIRNDLTRQLAYYDTGMHEKSLLSMRLINEIKEAIRGKQLRVYYQPKFGIQGEKPVLRSAEALIRWVHPELGMISPGVFIPLFEENGLIQMVDDYVWREAGAQIREWREKYGIRIPVSVNVSRVDLYDPDIRQKFAKILEDNGLNADDLYLEITESAYTEDSLQLIEVVKGLREDGFRIEMDDFGSGYSSLNMLNALPIDVLKMDMKFIRNIHVDPRSLRLVEIVMEIAGFLSVPVVAEGVEYPEQYELLKEAGCDIVQGFLFSKPVPPAEFEVFIQERMK